MSVQGVVDGEAHGQSPDSKMLSRLRERVVQALLAGDGPMEAVFTARFPLGARVPGAVGPDAVLRVDSTAGPGWRRVGSWGDVAAVVVQGGDAGFSLVRLADPDQGVVGVHVRVRDGVAPVFWVIFVRPGADPGYGRFHELTAAGLPAPGHVVVVNYCADVQLPPGTGANG